MLPDYAWNSVPTSFPDQVPPRLGALLERTEMREREARELRALAWAGYLVERLRQALAEQDGLPSGEGWADQFGPDLAGFTSWRALLACAPSQLRAGFILVPESVEWAIGLSWNPPPPIPPPPPPWPAPQFRFGAVIEVDVSQWIQPKLRFRREVLIGSVPDPRGWSNFPLLLRLVAPEWLQPPHPTGAASSACWVVPRSGRPATWSVGILTARHVIPPGHRHVGAVVPITDPLGQPLGVPVADIAGRDMIDAAILDAAPLNPRPPVPPAVPAQQAIAPGQTVQLSLRSGGVSASVLEVTPVFSGYLGHLCADRILLDTSGQYGDSGSFVEAASTAVEATGLLVGAIPAANGQPATQGLVQSMRQVVEFFDIDLHLKP